MQVEAAVADDHDDWWRASAWGATMLPNGRERSPPMTIRPDVPSGAPCWVDLLSSDRALAEVEALGGTTILGGEHTPYGVLATAADATGAMFRLRADG